MAAALLLTTILAVGLIAAGVASVVRAVAPQEWLLHKPLSCDLCMSWWSSFVMTAWVHVLEKPPFPFLVSVIFGATMVSIVALKTANRLGE